MKCSIIFRFSVLITLLSVFISCGESLEDRMKKQVKTIDEMSELGTVEYTITKIVKADDCAFYKIGERKILFSCRAYMKAGIDMADFNADNITVNESEKLVSIILPKPRVLSFNLPVEEARLEYEKAGGLRFDFTAEERNDLLKQGEASILADAENLGILADAEKNARLFFDALLKQVGFEKVNVEFK